VVARTGPRALHALRLVGREAVARASPPDHVDGGGVLGDLALTLELLVEAEDGALVLVSEVAGAAAPDGDVGVGVGVDGDGGGGAGGGGGGGDLGGVDVGDVAGAAAARVEVVAGGDGGVRLGDVVGCHGGRGGNRHVTVMDVWEGKM